MTKPSIFNNIFATFIIFFTTLIVNFISSIHFYPIFFFGVVLLALFYALKNERLYSVFFLCLLLFFLELNNGFIPFNLILLALFIYSFIQPYIKRVSSFSSLNDYIYVLFFYLFMGVIYTFTHDYSLDLVFTLLINILIDFILIGLFV